MIDTAVLRQKILDLAIRGKLVPQDPRDEPASVLLERIRAEKQQMVKDGKLKPKDIKNDTIIFKGDDNLHYEKFQDGTVKCIEDEIPFEVPEGWEWTRIFSVAIDLPYGTAKKSSNEGKIAVLRMGNIQSGEIDYDDLVYSSDEKDIEKYLLQTDDLLFNRTNSSEWVGKTAIYRGDIPAIFAGYLIRIRSFLNAEYLNVVMNSGYAKNYCNYVKTDAVNQSNINAQKLGNFLVPISPTEEQIRIDNRITELLPLVSEIQIMKERTSHSIGNIKAKILDLAIRGKLVPQDPNDEPASVLLERIRTEKEDLIKQGKIKRDKNESVIYKGDDNSYYEKFRDGTKICIDDDIPFEIPFGWEWCRLSTVSDIVTGGTPSKSYPEFYGNEFPFFKPADLDQGENTITPSEFLSSKGKSNCRIIPKYSTAVCCIGTIGKCGFLKVDGTTNQQINSVISNIDKKYMYYYCCSELFTMQLLSLVSATTIAIVNKRKMESVLIPIPPVEEQPRIVSTIESCMHNLNSISTI